MSWFQKKKQEQNSCAVSTPRRSPEAALLDTAINLLSYILAAARKKEDPILPEFLEYYGSGSSGFHQRDYIRTEDLHTWMNLVTEKQKERAELKELTAKVETILETDYGMKPKAKKSAK